MSCFLGLKTLYRPCRRSSGSSIATMDEEEMRRLCRRRRERIDSITPEILAQRMLYQRRLEGMEVDLSLVRALEDAGFGRKRKLPNIYRAISSDSTGSSKMTHTAAGGFAQFLAAASRDWPVFEHLLPEIALAGHSNCGKSTLVNALTGSTPSKGKASVSDRAGWTDQVCFYQLGKRPPVMTLVDLPGYGHAVASEHHRQQWQRMIRSYLGGARPVLSRCYVLVDCSRGLCAEDRSLMRFLSKAGTHWRVILTKADLLSCDLLASSLAAVKADAGEVLGAEVEVLPVSSSTGAGIGRLWRELGVCVDACAKPAPRGSVREHLLADALRRSTAQRKP